MKVQGMVDPGRFTVEQIPGSNRCLVRLFQNVEPVKDEKFEGFQYDEYHVEVESWDGVAQNVAENYDEFLKKGMDNEVDRSNEALFRAQTETDSAVRDMDEMSIDQEYRLTMLELGLTDADI